MRCPDCNKFVSFDTDVDPEIDNLEVNEDGHVTASVRIVNSCADCGTELTETTFEMEGDVDFSDETDHVPHSGEGHELSVEEESSERTYRQDGKPKTKARYRRSFYGVQVIAKVTCSCGALDVEVEMSDECMASWMDSLV